MLLLNRSRWCALTALLVLGGASGAEAQDWLEDRARAEGPGFRIGDFELHPGLGVELGYDTNLYYTEDDPGPMHPALRDSAILRATAHLLFATRGEQRRPEGESGGAGPGDSQPDVTFRGGLTGSFYHFFNDNSRTNMEVGAQLQLGVLPGRPFNFTITNDFDRSIRPFTENTFAGSYARIQNTAGVDFNFLTSGEVLKITLGYRFRLDFFEDSVFQYGNNFQHHIVLTETFRFLPQTAIVHDTGIVIADYWATPDPLDPTAVNDGYLLRTRVGLNGAFTNEFSVLAMIGYGVGFFNQPVAVYDIEYESVVAQVEARWQITPDARLNFGYDRDFQPSFVGNFYRRDRGYANFQLLFAGSFLLGLEATVGYYEFGAIVRPDGTTPIGTTLARGDIRFTAALFAEYRFTDWLGVNGTVRYTGNFTDYQYNVPDGMGGAFIDPAQYNKLELWLGVRVFY
jgi:hypothetical protein